jgi:hypothetical protein
VDDSKRRLDVAIPILGANVSKATLVLAAAVLFSSTTLAFGQDGYFSNWFNRVDKTQSEQLLYAAADSATASRVTEMTLMTN